MAKVKVETYSIQAKKRNSRKEEDYYALDDITGAHFIDIFQEYLGSLWGNSAKSEEQQKILTFEPTSKMLSRTDAFWHIAGRVRLGDYGTANPIVNVDTMEITHEKSDRESEMFPLYFLICGRAGFSKAVVIFQRYGNVGMSSQFKRTFSNFILNNFGHISAPLLPLVPRELLETMLNAGTITQVIMRRNRLPGSAIERLRQKGFTESVQKMDLIFKGEGNVFSKNSIRGWIRDPETRFITIEEMRDYGLDGDHEVLVKVSIGGTEREIDFGNTLRIRPYIDIHSDLELGPDKHPLIESIHEISLSLGRQLLSDEL